MTDKSLKAYCPKCQCRNVTIICQSDKSVREYSIDELPELRPEFSAEHLILIHKRWSATCDDCGYTKEWIE